MLKSDGFVIISEDVKRLRHGSNKLCMGDGIEQNDMNIGFLGNGFRGWTKIAQGVNKWCLGLEGPDINLLGSINVSMQKLIKHFHGSIFARLLTIDFNHVALGSCAILDFPPFSELYAPVPIRVIAP